jgi:hypothetical protein
MPTGYAPETRYRGKDESLRDLLNPKRPTCRISRLRRRRSALLFLDGTWNQVSDNAQHLAFPRADRAGRLRWPRPARVLLDRPRHQIRRPHQRRHVWRRHRFRYHQRIRMADGELSPGRRGLYLRLQPRRLHRPKPVGIRFQMRAVAERSLGGQPDLHAPPPPGQRTTERQF